MTDKTVRFVIRRQATPQSEPFWEEFDLRWRPGMNVISGLMDIAMNPVDRTGKPTTPLPMTPIVWRRYAGLVP